MNPRPADRIMGAAVELVRAGPADAETVALIVNAPGVVERWTAVAVDELMDLGRHPAARATEGMVGRLGPQILVVRFSPLCGARLGPRPGSTWWRAGERG